MTGSNKTRCSVLWLCWCQQENVLSQLAFPQTEGGHPVTPSTIPCCLDRHFQKHLHQILSLLPTLPFTMDGTEENLWNRSFAKCFWSLALDTGRTWQRAFLQTIPRLKHPSYILWSLNQKGRNNPAQALNSHCLISGVDPPKGTQARRLI